MASSRLLRLLLYLLPLLAVVLAGTGAVWRAAERSLSQLPALLAQAVSSSLGREVRIGRAEWDGKRLVLTDISIADGKSFAERPALASAERVEADVEWQRLLFPGDPLQPFVDTVRVSRPMVRLRRDNKGSWNVATLFPEARRPGARSLAHEVRVAQGTLSYSDGALRLPWKAAQSRLNARLGSISGSLYLEPRDRYRWRASGRSQGPLRRASVEGSYSGATARLVLTANDLRGPAAAWSGYLPRGWRASSGDASASFTLAHDFDSAHGPSYFIRSALLGSKVQTPNLRYPVEVARASATISPDGYRAEGAFRIQGVSWQAAGRASPGDNSRIHARIQTRNAPLQRLASLITEEQGFRLPEGLTGQLDVSGVVAGSLKSPRTSTVIRGKLDRLRLKNLSLPQGARVTVTADGALSSPRLRYHATAPAVEAQGVAASSAVAEGELRGNLLTARLAARLAGGSLTARFTLPDYRHADAYRGSAQIRGIALPLLVEQLRAPEPWFGILAADVAFAKGRRADLRSQWTALATDFGRSRYAVAEARAHGRTHGKLILLTYGELADEAGNLRVTGTLHSGSRRADLQFEADDVNLGAFAQRYFETGGPEWEGSLSVRGGRVTGSWSRPRYEAHLEAIAPSAGGIGADYASASVFGDLNTLWIGSAEIWRLPGTATVLGAIRRPFETGAVASLQLDFSDLEISDALREAGLETDVAGTASGEAVIAGTLSSPRIEVSPLQVAGLEAGGVAFAEASGRLVFLPFENDWLLVPEAAASVEGAEIELSGALAKDGKFSVRASAQGIELNRFNASLGRWAAMEGRARAEAEIRGDLKDGEWRSGSGSMRLEASDVRANDQPVGKLLAQGELSPDGFRARGQEGAPPPIQLAGPAGTLSVGSLEYDHRRRTISATGLLSNSPVASLLGLVRRSPAMPEHGESAQLLSRLSDPAAPLSGEVSASFTVRSDWSDRPDRSDRTGPSASVSIALPSTELRLGESRLRIEGVYETGGALSANALLEAIPIERLREWFPDGGALDRMSGTLSSFSAALTGPADSLRVRGSAKLNDVTYALATGPDGEDRTVRLTALDIGSFELGDGKVRAAGVGAEFLAGEGGGSARRLRVQASAEADFDIERFELPENSKARIQLIVPEQDLSLLTGLFPGARIETDGRISADLTLRGAVAELRDPQGAGTNSSLSLDGRLALAAKRLRLAGSRTLLTDVNLPLAFSGDRIRLDTGGEAGSTPVAVVRVSDPRTGKFVAASEPLLLGGELPLRAAAPQAAMRLQSKRLVFAESPLPFYRSGRTAGELSSRNPSENGLDLTIGGSALRPEVSGALRVRKADVRLPDEEGEFPRRGESGWFRPEFRLAIHAGDQVRVSAGQLSASVRTAEFLPILLQGTIAAPRLAGTLLVDSGALQFPVTRFQVVPGGLISLRYPSFDSLDSADPSLSVLVRLSARARVAARSVTRETKLYTVTVNARGPLNADRPLSVSAEGTRPSGADGSGLQLTFQADPPDLALTAQGLQNRIAGILGGEEAIQGLFGRSSGRSGAMAERLSGILSNRFVPDLIERTGLAQALGLELLDLEYDPTQSFTLRVSRQLAGPFEMSFLRRFGASRFTSAPEYAAWEMRTSARLRRDLRLSWNVDEQKTNAYLLEGVFRF